MDLEKIESPSPFFEDLTPGYEGFFWGYRVSIPSFEKIQALTYEWLLWMLEEAGRFGEIGDRSVVIEGDIEVSKDVFTGSVGEKEINARVRVTAINGIQHEKNDAIHLWEDISKLFATRVHFIYNETKGSKAVDGTHAFWDKYVRENPGTAKVLAEKWEELLKEMGDDGYIYHIAHSHGALLTTQAADMVSSEVRSRLIIRTYGAFQNPHQQDFADIKNIVCIYDPIVRWLNWYEDRGDVVRLKGVENPESINENHSLRGAPYWNYLKDHESFNFREKYESSYSKMKTWIWSLWDSPKADLSEGASD
jgi:hypothetical protein